eukprot:6470802-Amphidinium_carterae.1
MPCCLGRLTSQSFYDQPEILMGLTNSLATKRLMSPRHADCATAAGPIKDECSAVRKGMEQRPKASCKGGSAHTKAWQQHLESITMKPLMVSNLVTAGVPLCSMWGIGSVSGHTDQR